MKKSLAKRGHYTIQSTKKVYKNPWIEVREDTVVRDGKEETWGVLHIKPGASILAMDDEGYVYLTKEFHYGAGEETIEVVAGGTDDNENVLETAKRELKEETGLEALEWISLGTARALTTYTDHVQHLYLARGLTVGKYLESINVLKVPFADAHQWALESKIVSAYCALLILRTAEYLKKKS